MAVLKDPWQSPPPNVAGGEGEVWREEAAAASSPLSDRGGSPAVRVAARIVPNSIDY
jgi:hypothetical protein